MGPGECGSLGGDGLGCGCEYSALAELGLKLQPGTGTVETVVIDHVERPSQN